MGGGMRQSGYLAAACLYALDNNVDRLKEDNLRAKQLGDHLKSCIKVVDVRDVKTNIVIFELAEGYTANLCVEALKKKGIGASAFGAQEVRFVTHMDVTDQHIDEVCTTLSEILN